MGETLTRKFGPLPVWAWTILFILVLAIYLKYRSGKQAAAQAQQQNQNNQGLQSESANAAADNLATESWPMPANYGNGSVTAPQAPDAPYPGSPMHTWNGGAGSLNTASAPAPSPATQVS